MLETNTESEVKEKFLTRISSLLNNASATEIETLSVAFETVAKIGKEDVQAKYFDSMMKLLIDVKNFKPASPFDTNNGLGLADISSEIKDSSNDFSRIDK